ncbi:hypothetical protein LTS15_001025 [Exophiala xenobiotica]|nr:hypothetical protein LTS15_001025 [Exophiala xenobiotica]
MSTAENVDHGTDKIETTMVETSVSHPKHGSHGQRSTTVPTLDPLTWSKWTKIGITANICANAFINNVTSAGVVPTLGPIVVELNVPITTAGQILSYAVLSQGLGNLIWVPTMLVFGKRWTIIATSVLLLPAIAWCASAQSFNSLLAARIVSGFASGASESFAPAIIGDIWYERDLTLALGIFALCIVAGAGLGQAALGYVTQGIGWRWAFWVTFIIAAINFVTMIIWLPETTYQRGLKVGVTAGDLERKIELEHGDTETFALEKDNTNNLTNAPTIEDAPPLVSMRPNLWFIRHPHVNYKLNWLRQFARPFQFFLSPSVLWASLTYAVAAGAFTAVGVCIPLLLGGPPYLFQPGAQGLFGLSALVGVCIGGTVGSRIVDVFSNHMERRRRKAGAPHKPEERLVMLILPFCTVTVGLIVYGITVEQKRPWIAPAVGYTIHSAGFSLLASITYSYIIDSYLIRSGEAMVFNNMLRALLSFAFADFVPNWLVRSGSTEVYCVLAGVVWAMLLLGIPLFYLGPSLRAKTDRFL